MGMTMVAAALGTWFGIHALRMALSMIVWNVAEDDTAFAGQVAALVWAAGIGGSFLAHRIPLARPAVSLAALFGVLQILRQAFPGESTSPAFAFAAWIVWLWWLPAFVRQASGRLPEVAGGVVLGVALQVAGQIALHGLDLPLLQGPASVVATLLLTAALTLAVVGAGKDAGPVGGAWGAFAIGPYLFVQLTFLANLGRLEVVTGLPPLITQVVLALGFGLALVATARGLPRAGRITLAVLAVIVLIPGQSLGALTLALVVVAQLGLALGLRSAFQTGARLASSVQAGAALGALVFFLFVFVFYSFRDRVDWLWPIAAALVVAPGIVAPRAAIARSLRPAIAAAAAVIAAVAVAAIPAATTSPAAAGDAQVRVLSYNQHQGLDTWSVPSAPALAERIESAGADLVALQEVNRGWNLSAGIDHFAYLRWRLPHYYAVYGPMDTALYGNAILSRYPILESGHGILPRASSSLPRGYVWAYVDAPSGRLLVVSTHFTSYAGFEAERLAQADAFIRFWNERPRSILAGDYNARPGEPEVARLRSAGLVDAAAAVGLGAEPTYSSGDPRERIDYVLVSPDIRPVKGELLSGAASDHRPVFLVLEIP